MSIFNVNSSNSGLKVATYTGTTSSTQQDEIVIPVDARPTSFLLVNAGARADYIWNSSTNYIMCLTYTAVTGSISYTVMQYYSGWLQPRIYRSSGSVSVTLSDNSVTLTCTASTYKFLVSAKSSAPNTYYLIYTTS